MIGFAGFLQKRYAKAKNRNHLLKAKKMAEEMGMEDGKELFPD